MFIEPTHAPSMIVILDTRVTTEPAVAGPLTDALTDPASIPMGLLAP
ncbi:hypothetical protein [Mycetocola tolaasinivorans]|nr:hypothetical protein [Mycetocola tolaasinivorans]